ncbi:MAG: hypothetical protein GC180_12290 [Bacteroidetes bacterium]|nr:hypothetical protein [Bacteroidota bacterium]
MDRSAWNFTRVLRVSLGTAVLIAAIAQKDIMPALFGILFLYQGIYNTGCPGGSCGVPYHSDGEEHRAASEYLEVESEEIKTDKR